MAKLPHGRLVSIGFVSVLIVLVTGKSSNSGCFYQGKIYKFGQALPSTDPCRSCKCDARLKEPLCLTSKCSMPLCGHTYIPEGKCCPVCACKDTKGRMHKPGHNFLSIMKLHHHSICLKCKCKADSHGNHASSCKAPFCKKLKCLEYYIPEGECCPICRPLGYTYKSCKYDLSIKKHNEEWRVGKCFKCKCEDGVIQCYKPCPPLSCPLPIHRTGKCCPECKAFPKPGRGWPFPVFPGRGKRKLMKTDY